MKSIFFVSVMSVLMCGCAQRGRREVPAKVREEDGERVVEVRPTPTPSEKRDLFDGQVDATGWPKRP